MALLSLMWIRLYLLIGEAFLFSLLQGFSPAAAVRSFISSGRPLAHLSPRIPLLPHLEGLPWGRPRRKRAPAGPLGNCGFAAHEPLAVKRLRQGSAPLRGPMMFVQRGGGPPPTSRSCKHLCGGRPTRLKARGPHGAPSGASYDTQRAAASALRREVVRKAKGAEEMNAAFPVALRVPHPELIAGEREPCRALGFRVLGFGF